MSGTVYFSFWLVTAVILGISALCAARETYITADDYQIVRYKISRLSKILWIAFSIWVAPVLFRAYCYVALL